jgi:competence protein ComEC
VVIAGVIFITLRLLLLLLPARISLRPESKPIIAILTLLLVTVYLFVTGLPMSAVRAYFMIALVLLAVILRRQVDPMRSLAITAFVMLVNDPASLLDPGFQLSFAATLALISLIEVRVLKAQPVLERGRVRRVFYHITSLLLVSFVAECATEPLVISMFNNVSPYGIFANSLATPLVSFFLMPLVALFFILLPLGLKHVALVLMSYGIDALMWLGRWVASFPHAQLFCPSLPGWGLALFVLGLAWTCLWRTRVRRYGLIACVLGVLSLLTVTPPDMVVGGSLKQIAFRSDDDYVLARGRATSMLPEMWANGLGYRVMEKADEPEWRCDGLGCIAKVKSIAVAFPRDMAALGEDCQHAQVIITSADAACNTGALVLDPKRLAGSSVTALWVKPDGKVHVETSAQWQGKRPWSIGPADMDEDSD